MRKHADNRFEGFARMSSHDFIEWLTSEGDENRSLACKRIYGPIEIPTEKKLNIPLKFIRDCLFENQIHLGATYVEKLTFRGCVFLEIAEFLPKFQRQKFQINDCEFSELNLARTSSINGDQTIEINDTTIENTLSFNTLRNLRISLSNVAAKDVEFISFDENAIIEWLECHNLEVTAKVSFDYSSKIKGAFFYSGNVVNVELAGHFETLSFEGNPSLNIEGLDMRGFEGGEDVIFRNTTIGLLDMRNITNDANKFRFYDCTISSEWRMTYSAPNHLVALNIDLSSCKMCFDNSLLNNCTFSNIDWPKQKRLYSEHFDAQKNCSSLREAYRQLKQAMLKDGNNIDALAFYRNELEEYRSFTKDNTEVKREDKIILWMMWLFSDHGQSFARPIAWLLGMHLFFFLIAIALNYNGFYFTTNHDWSAVWDFIGSYLFLLNPVHKLPDITGGMLIVDFFMRLCSGFFIYHIIRASRKFAKV